MNIINKIGQYRQAGRSWYQRQVNTISVITIHHTASRQVDDDATALNNVYRAHVNNGWPGFAYHFFIAKSGNIYQVNAFEDVSWHDTRNYDSIGVCLDGYFHPDINEKPTQEQLKSLKELLDWLCTENPQFPASHANVYGHRERSSTACPGNELFPYVTDYRNKLGNVTWGVVLDPLAECLAQHKTLVEEVTLLKDEVTKLKATEERLKEEKDGIVAEKDTIITGLNDKLKSQQVRIDGFQTEKDKLLSDSSFNCLSSKKHLLNQINLLIEKLAKDLSKNI